MNLRYRVFTEPAKPKHLPLSQVNFVYIGYQTLLIYAWQHLCASCIVCKSTVKKTALYVRSEEHMVLYL